MIERFPRQYLLRQVSRMSGLARFPVESEGGMTRDMVDAAIEETLIVLNEACVSEEHVATSIAEWLYDKDFFPTPAELRRKAWTIRPRYEPAFQVEEPRHPPMGPPVAMSDELRELWTQACAGADKQTEMWAAIKRDLRVADFSKVTWSEIAASKERLGYELKPHEREMLNNLRGVERPLAPRKVASILPPVPVHRITAEDVERAKRKHDEERLFGE